jgi:peptidyl-tRNA hydrolase
MGQWLWSNVMADKQMIDKTAVRDPGAWKMYCIVPQEIVDLAEAAGNVRGKLMAQSGHAFLHAWWDADRFFPENAKAYRDSERAYKITLVAPYGYDLFKLGIKYGSFTGSSLVEDSGFTVFDGPTVTCLGIGPINVDDIGPDLKALKTLR